MNISTELLKKLLVEPGIVSDEDFKKAESESKKEGLPLTQVLISSGLVPSEFLAKAVGQYLNFPFADLSEIAIPEDILGMLPEETAQSRRVVVFDRDPENKILKVAMEDPFDAASQEYLRRMFPDYTIGFYITTSESLVSALQLYKVRFGEEFESIISKALSEARAVKGKEVLESVPLARLFDSIFNYAITHGASDVYFQPAETTIKIRFRIDGILRTILEIDKLLLPGLVTRAKILSGLRIDEHLKPQDGRFRFKGIAGKEIDARTAVIPTFFGERVTFRLLNPVQTLISLEDLGMSEEIAGRIRREIKRPYGMILSTGPTGSGKTTTIYSLIRLLHRPEINITTIEDPIEYVIDGLSQTQVNIQAGITFATGLRSLLRHDPDVIVVGEIRDSETADIAIHAALTGHILISTLHTNDALTAVPRLIDLGIQPFLIASTLNIVLAQRLVQKICPSCRASFDAPQEAHDAIFELLGTFYERSIIEKKLPRVLYRGLGCKACRGKGYSGRTAVFEVLIIDEAMRAYINSGQITVEGLRELAKKQGMIPMFEDGLEKVERGVTTLEEVIRVSRG